MKKICLVVVGIYLNLFGVFAQLKDSSSYRLRKLKIVEINFISSYYNQDGNNSAVTGGTGTEALTDYSNSFEVKLANYNKRRRRQDIDINLGIDYYTSASSDKIDPTSISSASHEDLRIYPSVTRTISNEKKGNSFLTAVSFSHESDYNSFGFGGGISKKSKDNNTEFTARAQAYLDQVKIILPIELRTATTGGVTGAPNQYDYPWKHRNTFTASLGLSKVVNQHFQLMTFLDLTYQQGFLGLPFHRIYFKYGAIATEKLPSSRFKIPIAVRANYFFGSRIILRSLYRFYKDDWGLNAHTTDLEASIKLTPFFSLTPFFRFYSQSAIDFFAGYQEHLQSEPYYSSNYDLSKFNSHFFGGGVRLAPPQGLFGHKRWNMVEVRYGYYKRSNGLHAGIVSLNVRWK